MAPEEYLQSKGFKLRPAPGQWQTQCPFCGDKNKYGHLYVNREHGAWMCHRCGEAGSYYSLQEKLGDSPSPASKTWASKQQVWEALIQICEAALVDNTDHMDYLFKERGLKAKTITDNRLGFVPRDALHQLRDRGFSMGEIRNAGLLNDKNSIIFWDSLLIPYTDGHQPTWVRAKNIAGGRTIGPKDTSIRLFGVDRIKGRKEVFICEGEMDALYLSQLGYAACGIPGATSFQEHWSTYFDSALRVFVVLDADKAGREGAIRIEQYLGQKARIVDLPVPEGEDSTDVTELFTRDGWSRSDFEAMIMELRGRRVFTIEEAFVEGEKLQNTPGIKTGIGELDELILPGLLPGQVITVLAKTGTGKTAFITQLLHNLSSWESPDADQTGPGEPTLVLSLEQTKSEIAERLKRIGRFYNPWMERADMSKWHSMMRINDENRIPPNDVPLIIDEFVDEVGVPPKIIVVDYLGYWARAFKGNKPYERVSEAVMELKRLAKDTETVIVAPHQVSRLQKRGEGLDLDHARDSGAVEETSDHVFGLFKPKDADPADDTIEWPLRADTRLQILKSRHGNNGRQVHLLWNPYSLAFTSVGGGPMYRRSEREWDLYDVRGTYSEALSGHRSDPLPQQHLKV